MPKHEIDIELDERVAEGDYANLVVISHSSSEFVLDFAALMPGIPKARVKNRIIIAPEHAKRLLISLQDNITKYETNVGKIELKIRPEETMDDESLVGFNMGEA